MNAEQEGMGVSSSRLGELIPPRGNIFNAPTTRQLKQRAALQCCLHFWEEIKTEQEVVENRNFRQLTVSVALAISFFPGKSTVRPKPLRK
jgi:hypothetical protein